MERTSQRVHRPFHAEWANWAWCSRSRLCRQIGLPCLNGKIPSTVKRVDSA